MKMAYVPAHRACALQNRQGAAWEKARAEYLVGCLPAALWCSLRRRLGKPTPLLGSTCHDGCCRPKLGAAFAPLCHAVPSSPSAGFAPGLDLEELERLLVW